MELRIEICWQGGIVSWGNSILCKDFICKYITAKYLSGYYI